MTRATTITIPTLATERLTLRAPLPGDAESLADFYASPRSKGIGGPFPRALAFDSLCKISGHWHLRGYGRWVLADPADDTPLGIVGLMYPEDWPEPEIAWTLFEQAEGKGFAYEAATFAREYAYTTLGWTTVVSCVMPQNTRSIALAKRMGATFDYIHVHPDLGDLHVWRHPAPQETRH